MNMEDAVAIALAALIISAIIAIKDIISFWYSRPKLKIKIKYFGISDLETSGSEGKYNDGYGRLVKIPKIRNQFKTQLLLTNRGGGDISVEQIAIFWKWPIPDGKKPDDVDNFCYINEIPFTFYKTKIISIEGYVAPYIDIAVSNGKLNREDVKFRPLLEIVITLTNGKTIKKKLSYGLTE